MSELERDPADTWLSTAQAVQVTGRSERTLTRWIRDGRVRVVLVAGRRRIRELDLLTAERDTRRAARRGRPGARLAASAARQGEEESGGA